MSERPIFFSAPMVRAILDGRKTQTRRLIKRGALRTMLDAGVPCDVLSAPMNDHLWLYRPGDLLWVRETFSYSTVSYSIAPSGTLPLIWCWADGNPDDGDWSRPKPSIHMPRWASRITLRVTATRIERLQEISEEDAMAEGVVAFREVGREHAEPHRLNFQLTWNSLHGPGSWESNPEVVVLTFERVTP